MTKAKIRKRCREVYLHIAQNKIFANEEGHEYEFVRLYRRETYAIDRLRDIDMARMEWEKYKGAKPPTRVIGFYLVPVTKIDDHTDWSKNHDNDVKNNCNITKPF